MALNIYLNLDDGTVARDQAGLTGFNGLSLNQGDNVKVNLYFTRNVTTAERTEIVPIPAPYTLIAIAGRDSKSMDDPSDELFYQGDWTEVVETLEDDTTETHYEALLSLRRTSLDDWLGTELSKPVSWSVTLTDGADAEWTPLIRGAGTVFRDLHRSDGDDVGVDPPDYPAADQIAPITGSNFRFNNAGGGYRLQIKNTTTNAWHTVHIEGTAGNEVLVIDTAS